MATRVLHGTANIANIPQCLARAARDQDIRADAYSIQPHPAHDTHDLVVDFGPGRNRKLIWNTIRFALRYQAFHFHFGQSLLGATLSDVPWLARLGKEIYFHFHGCDLRDSKRNIASYDITVCKACWPQLCSANRPKALEMAERHGKAVFVSTPDLLEFYDGSIWLPQSVDLPQLDATLDSISAQAREDRGTVRIAHSPTSRLMKGSQFVTDAVERLQKKGLSVELMLVENVSHREALAVCASADIVVDQLQAGWYGTFAVEMMAMRKPVVCYVRDDIADRLAAAPPVLSASPFDIEQKLEQLVVERERWPHMGERGRRYVEAFHDCREHALYLAEFYGRDRSAWPAGLETRFVDRKLAGDGPTKVIAPHPARQPRAAAERPA